MDFYRIKQRRGKNGTLEVYPDYVICRSKDLMVRGRSFYAIWDEEIGLWSTDEYDVQRLVDADLMNYETWLKGKTNDPVHTQMLGDFSSSSWKQFRSYLLHLSDNHHPLDKKITFANTEVRKEDYVSRRLPYSLAEDSHAPAYDELVGVLYDPSERAKLEWAVGAIISGDATWIQKFVVLYGAAGAGKSTFLNIVKRLFEGYYATFDAKALVGNSQQFATEVFKSNPLVAIQDDGDLSRIEDNTRLNSIISHEEIVINEKNKPTYSLALSAFLFMGTNKAVKITDAKSGIIRRLIDVQPSGRKVAPRHYQTLMQQINFELGAIAKHCLEVYLSMGPDYYSDYKPIEMMLQTDIFYNFVEAHLKTLSNPDGIGLDQAYEMYKQYCEDALVEYKLARHRFREELKNYFTTFEERKMVNGERERSWFTGFRHEVFSSHVGVPVQTGDKPLPLVLSDQDSSFEAMAAEYPAQYANESGTPNYKWEDVDTTLGDLDTSRTHYVRVPENHIVIDFDLTNEDGEKDLGLNLEAASEWPPTYTEPSKSGQGVHLHYIYDGDAASLSRIYAPGIEIKVFTGLSSLRRKRSINNGLAVATISGGLPVKEKKVLNAEAVKSEKGLRRLIARNLLKEIHPGTKPSIDFIHKILEDAYESGLVYDVSDMYNDVLVFANNSTNNAMYCLKVVQYMKFSSEGKHEDETVVEEPKDGRIVYFDVESFPNLFVVCWKFEGADTVTRMINPGAQEIIDLLKLKLVGYNNRKYDNHMLHAASLGYDVEALYRLSQRIVSNDRGALFGQAYGHSYFDMYDVSTKKQSLKLFQIELGLVHNELGLPWDQPVPPELWDKVAEYCANDVVSLEQVCAARAGDIKAREILAELSGRRMNDTTQQHTAAIVFEGNKKPQSEFVYTDLSQDFPGYEWTITTKGVVSTYQGETVGEGGLVRAKPGMYRDVALLDVESMHPSSIINLNAFGDRYTANFNELLQARLTIKHGDYDSARKMFNGRLEPYLREEGDAKSLSYALKIAINIVYGLTAAGFDNPFKDPRNKDNIVAKRGALFMIDLKNKLEEEGIEWVHIKTDSVKIANATPEQIDRVMEIGQEYGYDFEHEATYERFALVNDAVYIAKVAAGREPAHWTATGAQFAEPYVFKTLFSKEAVEFNDYIQTKSVTTALYLDFGIEQPMALADRTEDARFVGRVGAFVPVYPDCGGGALLRIDKNGEKYHSVVGTKGYLWKEADVVRQLNEVDKINLDYYEDLVYKARKNLEQYGDLEWFLDA